MNVRENIRGAVFFAAFLLVVGLAVGTGTVTISDTSVDLDNATLVNIGHSDTDFDSNGGLTLATNLTAGGTIKSTRVQGLEVDSSSDAQILADKNAWNDDAGLLLQTNDVLNWFVGTRNNEDFIIRNYQGTEANALVIDNETNGLTLAGDINLQNNLITNIGDSGTDFRNDGGLTISNDNVYAAGQQAIRVILSGEQDDTQSALFYQNNENSSKASVYINHDNSSADAVFIDSGKLDLNTNIIENIGAAGTDFDSDGGLSIADNLGVAGGIFVGGDSQINISKPSAGTLGLTTAGNIEIYVDTNDNDVANTKEFIIYNGDVPGGSPNELFSIDKEGDLFLSGADADDYITLDGNDDILFYKDGSCVFNATAGGACS